MFRTKKAEELPREIFDKLEPLIRSVNGNLGFGDGTDFDNVKGKWIQVTTTTANTEVAITHDLGAVPVGFLLMVPPENGTVNRGSSAWTTTQLFLKCSSASQTFTIFLLLDSSGSA
jgi:hypothetical protein